MKYLCLLYGNQEKMSKLSKADFAALAEKCKTYDAELNRTGAVRSVETLEWDVTTVRARDGKPTVIDGPFVETRERRRELSRDRGQRSQRCDPNCLVTSRSKHG
ncbi:MAG: YciI family protein [Polyangiaceae bacterium]